MAVRERQVGPASLLSPLTLRLVSLRSGKWRKYFGRGAKQLSYNFNYGQFSQAMFEDRRLLLDHPDFVADTWLNLASATWFYTTPQPPKPSMLHVIDGTWVPNEQVRLHSVTNVMVIGLVISIKC